MTCEFFDPDENKDSTEHIEFALDDTAQDLSDWDRDLERQVEIEDNIKIIEDNRKDIQKVNGSLLSVSGLLLTLSLGALYFGFNKQSTFNPPFVSIIFLILASVFLISSILKVISSLQLKPRIQTEKEELLGALQRSHDSEHFLTTTAIFRLKVAILCMFLGLVFMFLVAESGFIRSELNNFTINFNALVKILLISK
jgi:hypothetical protein